MPNINGLEFTTDGRVTSICRNPLAGVTITFDRVEGPMTPERLLNEPLPTRQVLPNEDFFEQVLESMSGE